jgi:hypothetical protein
MNELPLDLIIFTSCYFNIKDLLRFTMTNKEHNTCLRDVHEDFINMEHINWFWRRPPPPRALRMSWKHRRTREEDTPLLIFS